MSNFGKILIFITIFLILIVLFKSVNVTNKEGYEQNDAFLFKTGEEIYDEFYVDQNILAEQLAKTVNIEKRNCRCKMCL